VSAPLTPVELALLSRIAEALIPATATVPGAGEISCGAVLASDPDLAGRVRDALRALAAGVEDGVAAIAELASRDAPSADALLLVVATAYYGDARVRAAIGPTAIALPPLPDPADAELAPLLARVRVRGPAYRDVAPS